jgi:hypothetical protein
LLPSSSRRRCRRPPSQVRPSPLPPSLPFLPLSLAPFLDPPSFLTSPRRPPSQHLASSPSVAVAPLPAALPSCRGGPLCHATARSPHPTV